MLDRLVGYKISPLLWQRVQPGLSAGRVQSVALRLIVEREREILAFTPIEYWSVDARLTPQGRDPVPRPPGEVPEGIRRGARQEGRAAVGRGRGRRARRPAPRGATASPRWRGRSARRGRHPFTTSTLQQEAARKLGFGARKTMTLAQRLYEGVDLPGEGTVGLITYMRTDSVTIAEPALREIAELVRTDFGAEYALAEPRRYKTKSRNAQEAHEAIRPTSALRTPDRVAAPWTATSSGCTR